MQNVSHVEAPSDSPWKVSGWEANLAGVPAGHNAIAPAITHLRLARVSLHRPHRAAKKSTDDYVIALDAL
jgi:hypothetical protein